MSTVQTVGVQRLIDDLRRRSCDVAGPYQSNGCSFVLVREHMITSGAFMGQAVTIAVQAPPDYPQTPPPGFYVSPCIAPMDVQSVMDRTNETGQLEGKWQYWSRPVPQGKWDPNNGGRSLLVTWRTAMYNYGKPG